MADNTAAYGLVKPAVSEKVDIAVINGNMDKIDAALHTIATGLDAAEAAADSLEETVTDETSRTTLIEQTLGYTAKNLMGLDDFNETKTGFKATPHKDCTSSACAFPVILYKNSLTYVSMPASFLYKMTKKSTAHLPHNLCAVLP